MRHFDSLLEIGLACTIFVTLLWLLVELHALKRFRAGILQAREGLLDPVELTGVPWTVSGEVIAEYNVTITALQSMFRSVDDCQRHSIRQRNRMNTILQSLPGALLSMSEDITVNMANKQAEELFGRQADQLMGLNLFDVLYVSDRDRDVLRDAFLYKQPICNQEVTLTTPHGRRHCSLNLGFYSDEDNDFGGVLILQDISAHRQLQETVATREKLVAMGQLAAGVAHELNTPLGSVCGYAQLLGDAHDDPALVREYAQIIAVETRRCSRIVHDLLNYARADRCTGETCDINQLIAELIDTFLHCRMQRYEIAVRLDLSPGPLIVEGDCGQLEIVLTNLVINAIHAVDGVDRPQITLTSRLDVDIAEIGIADNGPGVPPELRHRVFDPFFTTKAVGEGSGLGLSISHAIVAKRGGFITYDGEYRHGGRFLLSLPAVDLKRVHH